MDPSARKLKTLSVNTMIIGAGTVASKALSILMVPIVTRFLDPSVYGTFDLVLTYLALAVPVITGQLDQAIFRYLFDGGREVRGYLISALLFVVTSGAIVAILLWVMLEIVFEAPYALPVSIYFVAFSVFTCSLEYFRGMGRLKSYAVLGFAVSLLAFGSVWVALSRFGQGIVGIFWALGGSYALVGTIVLVWIGVDLYRSGERAVPSLRKLGEMLKFSAPLVPNTIAYWIANVSDRTLVTIMLGASANGLYSVATKIPTFISVAFSVFNISFQQTAIEVVRERDGDRFLRALAQFLIAALLAAATILSGLCSRFFVDVFGPGYAASLVLVPGLLYAVVLLCLSQYVGNIQIAFRQTVELGKTTVVVALVNVILNLVLIPIVGVVGAVLSSVVSYTVLLVSRVCRVQVKLLDAGTIVVFCGCSALYWSVEVLKAMHLESELIWLALALSLVLQICVAVVSIWHLVVGR